MLWTVGPLFEIAGTQALGRLTRLTRLELHPRHLDATVAAPLAGGLQQCMPVHVPGVQAARLHPKHCLWCNSTSVARLQFLNSLREAWDHASRVNSSCPEAVQGREGH